MSTLEEIVERVALLPDQIQNVRDDMSEIELDLKGRISGCEARMNSVNGKVAQLLELFTEEFGGGVGHPAGAEARPSAGLTIDLQEEQKSAHKKSIPSVPPPPACDLSSDDDGTSETSDSEDDTVGMPPAEVLHSLRGDKTRGSRAGVEGEAEGVGGGAGNEPTPESGASTSTSKICYRCGSGQHLIRDCREPAPPPRKRKTRRGKKKKKGGRKIGLQSQCSFKFSKKYGSTSFE